MQAAADLSTLLILSNNVLSVLAAISRSTSLQNRAYSNSIILFGATNRTGFKWHWEISHAWNCTIHTFYLKFLLWSKREISQKDNCEDTYSISNSHSLMHSTCFDRENTAEAKLSNPNLRFFFPTELNCLILMKEKHHNKQRRLFRAEERCIWQIAL